jgi:hypothetical protein
MLAFRDRMLAFRDRMLAFRDRMLAFRDRMLAFNIFNIFYILYIFTFLKTYIILKILNAKKINILAFECYRDDDLLRNMLYKLITLVYYLTDFITF